MQIAHCSDKRIKMKLKITRWKWKIQLKWKIINTEFYWKLRKIFCKHANITVLLHLFDIALHFLLYSIFHNHHHPSYILPSFPFFYPYSIHLPCLFFILFIVYTFVRLPLCHTNTYNTVYFCISSCRMYVCAYMRTN